MGRIVWDDNFYRCNGKSTFAEFEFSYAEVIKGLNEFYSGETKNTLCEGYFRVFSEAHDTEYILLIDKWLNKAIEWLRVKHEIFYHPGMEARYAKTDEIYETVVERWRNRRAWDTIVSLHKTICKDSDETSPALMGEEITNRFDEYIDEFKKAESDCHAEIREVNDQRWKDLRDIYKALGCDGSVNGHIDDFAKAVKERAIVIKSERDRYLKQRDMAVADYKALCEENQKSDINKLISDYCAKNDIAPPSPYFSDKACVEYLFSVVDLERQHREAVGKQMVDNYEKDLLKLIYKKLEELLKDIKEEFA